MFNHTIASAQKVKTEHLGVIQQDNLDLLVKKATDNELYNKAWEKLRQLENFINNPEYQVCFEDSGYSRDSIHAFAIKDAHEMYPACGIDTRSLKQRWLDCIRKDRIELNNALESNSDIQTIRDSIQGLYKLCQETVFEM